MKITIEFDVADVDSRVKFERMYRSDVAWAALQESYEKIRLALKYLDSEEAFRDAIVETREIIYEALEAINE